MNKQRNKQSNLGCFSYVVLAISIFFLLGSFFGVDESTKETLPVIYGISSIAAIAFVICRVIIYIQQKASKLALQNIQYKVITQFEFKNLGCDEWEITKYIGFDEENIEIPAQIEDKKIVALGNELFAKNKTIKHVKLNNGITIIGDNAFDYCKSLKTISLPNTIKKIGAYAFRATSITEIVFPPSVEELGKGVFASDWVDPCKRSIVEKVMLSEGLIEIPDECFYRCKHLSQINIPRSVKRIGVHAFELCRKLPPIKLHEGLEVIEYEAFTDTFAWPSDIVLNRAKGVTLVFPKSLKYVGKYAFQRAGLVEVAFRPGCTAELSEGVFGLTCLKGLYIPESIANIDDIFHYFISGSKTVTDSAGNTSTESIVSSGSVDTSSGTSIMYCESGSRAMAYAREKGIKCAEYGSNFNELLKANNCSK